ncbi:MAG: lamin tail domain-containing protein, partial [Pirellulales bacterium]
MMKKSNRRSLRIDLLEPRLMLDSTVVFNELMYNPADTEETLEFIELHNQMAVDMDISGWRLDGGVNYTFPEGTIL